MKTVRLFVGILLWPLLLGFLLQPPPPPTPTPRPPTATFTPPLPTPTPTSSPTPRPTTSPTTRPPAATPHKEPECLSGLEGLLLEAGTNSPLAEVEVALRGEGWEARTVTGSDGKFRFYGLCYGVGTVHVAGMVVTEGNPRVFFDGRNLVQITLKVAAQVMPTPTATPAPTPGAGLPSTGWGVWLLPLAVFLGAAMLIIRRLRHSTYSN